MERIDRIIDESIHRVLNENKRESYVRDRCLVMSMRKMNQTSGAAGTYIMHVISNVFNGGLRNHPVVHLMYAIINDWDTYLSNRKFVVDMVRCLDSCDVPEQELHDASSISDIKYLYDKYYLSDR